MTGRERLLGTYELIAVRGRTARSSERDLLGAHPIGRTTYDRAGRMWSMIAPAGRASPPADRAPSPADYRQLLDGVVAYFGAYEVDEAAHHVVHRVVWSLQPALIGRELVRSYELSGDRLKLVLPADEVPAMELLYTEWRRLTDV